MASFEIVPFDRNVGAEIQGIDARRPLDPETLARLRAAVSTYGVLIFRGQSLTPTEQVAFSRYFGTLEVHIKKEFTLPEAPEVFVLSNIVENGRAIGVTNFAESWHSDGSHAEYPPIGALLYALEVPPEGADTQFASMYLAYEALDDAMRAKIDKLAAIHSYQTLQAALYPDKPVSEEVKRKTPDRHQSIVKTHPETGRRTLFLGDEIVTGVVGMPEPAGTELMNRLLAHATAERFVYTHKWKVGDLLFWDNRCTMHRVLPFDQERYRRRVHRTTLSSTAG
ncbi:MAG: TauD/TfdA family dioxygenase [Alphaproteobacteria bacterium]|nr:TauD/TfdA family dioxygenase [Alphaproteobacteria bacterium]